MQKNKGNPPMIWIVDYYCQIILMHNLTGPLCYVNLTRVVQHVVIISSLLWVFESLENIKKYESQGQVVQRVNSVVLCSDFSDISSDIVKIILLMSLI